MVVRSVAINSQPACLNLRVKRTYGGHRGIDANDPERTRAMRAYFLLTHLVRRHLWRA
jgi:hypothetical protein